MKMRNTKILIADDDAGILRLLGRALEPLDVEILEARDAVSALVLAQDARPDLIILDISMPCGNGLSACEMLASDRSLSHVPVIVLTGKSDDVTLFRCQHIGAHYVCKGADAIEQVRSLARRLLLLETEACLAQPSQFIG